jgi:hypothetical protein
VGNGTCFVLVLLETCELSLLGPCDFGWFCLPLGKRVVVSARRWEGGQVLLFWSGFDCFCFCSCLIFGGALSILSTSCTPQLLYFVLLFTLYSCVYYLCHSQKNVEYYEFEVDCFSIS